MFAVTATSFLSTTLKLVSTIGRFWHALPWTSLSSFIISDGVVIWRTWILYPERQWIMILPCLLLMGTTGTFVASPLSTAFFALSFTTNAISTLLILYQLWAHVGFRSHLGIQKRTRVTNVLLVLVEVGFVYCGIQGVALVLRSFNGSHWTPTYSTGAFVRSVMFELVIWAGAMYPSIIVLLVSTQCSVVETFHLSTEFMNVQRNTDPEQAIKDLELAREPTFPQRLGQDSALASSALNHPEIVPGVVDTGRAPDQVERNFAESSGAQATRSVPF